LTPPGPDSGSRNGSPAPLVSVIIPTNRRPRLVLRALEGVLRQSLRALEAIVVVDGPDPETMENLGSIDDPRLRVRVLSTAAGGAGARNAGVDEATGRWIAFLDDDDEWFPRKLEIQVRTAEQCPYAHPIVSCRLIARSEEGDLVWPRRTPAVDEPISEYLFCQSGARGGEGLVLPSTVLTTRNLLLRVPFRSDLPRHNDVDWLLRATAVESVAVVFVPDREPLAIWHIEGNRPRISNTADWQYSLGWMKANRGMVTPRAYASFLMIWASSTAARGRHWRAFWMLPWEAFANGRPRSIDFLAHFLIWLVPPKVRSKISVSLDTIRRKPRADAGNARSPKPEKTA
jgi:glycosyltransferase involved in cell wall biosynthesis